MAIQRKMPALFQGMMEKLVEGYAPEKVILFGSYAYGRPREDSDVDFLVIKETPERFIDRWVTVRRILSDPKRKVGLEVLVLTPRELSERLARGDQFIAEIVKKGRCFMPPSEPRITRELAVWA